MDNENANYCLNGANNDSLDCFDFDELSETLESEIESNLSDLEFLKEEKEQIGNPDALGETIKNVVWEQFLNQIAVTAGEDFIEENRGLKLDLRSEAHNQTTENFAKGKIATHNTEIDYQKRYDEWQSNFQKDENGNVTTHKTRTGKEEATLVKDARKPFDAGRPQGSAENHKDMDHTVPVAEIIRDPGINAHMTKEEQIEFANSDANLNEMDSSLNRSKGDKSMKDWLDNPNSNGQKPEEIFDISEPEKEKLTKKDKEAREELDKRKKEGEKRSIEAGKKSQKEEAFRISGKVLRSVVMQMLTELIKEIVGKLVKWFKESKKSFSTLIDSIKEAIKSFVSELKTRVLNAGKTLVTTILTSIIGPVVGTFKKFFTMLKQGWKSMKEAVSFLKDPKNKSMSMSLKLLEVGKIVMAGLSGVGALALGDVIEKGLLPIPGFGIEIPFLGSLANIIGVFMGAVIAGVIGAIVINWLNKFSARKLKEEKQKEINEKDNKILAAQYKLQILNESKLEADKEISSKNIYNRHKEAVLIMENAYESIMEDFVEELSDEKSDLVLDEDDISTNIEIDSVSDDLNEMLKGLI